ncbi:ribonuclease H-like domain-containing protein [Tanacetum coccineum]
MTGSDANANVKSSAHGTVENKGSNNEELLVKLLGCLGVSNPFDTHNGTTNGSPCIVNPTGSPSAFFTGPMVHTSPTPVATQSCHVWPTGPPPGFGYSPITPPGPVQYISPTPVQYQMAQPGLTVAPLGSPGSTGTSGQETTLLHAFNAGTLHDPATGAWNMDTGASSHLKALVNSLSEIFNTCMYPSISVGDGHSIPVTNTGHSIFPTPFKSLHLNNVLITYHIAKNLIFVRQFVPDNNYTIEFDAFGFSVKDFMTHRVLLRCDSTGDLYPLTAPSLIPHVFLVSQHTWNQRLGHPGRDVLRHLVFNNFISCNKEKPPMLCHACQLGKHVRLPFCDHGGEFDNRNLHKLFADNGIQFRFSCPKTSQQNDGMLSRYKARLVANGSTQLEGVDIDETFILVVKPGTIRTVLSLAAFRHWLIHQLDVKNAFYMGTDTAYLLLHVDDIVLTASSEILLQQIIRSLHQEAHMVNCNPNRTPIDTESKLGSDGDPVSDPTLYRSLAGSLQYFTFTRPDISYVVQQVCLHMYDPREPHFYALKRILRYVRATLDYGLRLFSSSTTDLVVYSDADWAGCPTTRRSTSGYCVFLGNNLLSWSSKRQPMLSRSNAEAEYRGVTNVVAETCWLRNLLHELHTPLSSAMLVYYLVAASQVQVLHVSSRYQFADIFTKGLPSALFEEFRSSLSVRCPPALTTGEC